MASNSAGLDFTPPRSENDQRPSLPPLPPPLLPPPPPPITTTTDIDSEKVKESSRALEQELFANPSSSINSNFAKEHVTNSHSNPRIINKDPLDLNSLPPAGSFVPNMGYVPRINVPPVSLTSRPSIIDPTPGVSAKPNKFQDRRAPSPEDHFSDNSSRKKKSKKKSGKKSKKKFDSSDFSSSSESSSDSSDSYVRKKSKKGKKSKKSRKISSSSSDEYELVGGRKAKKKLKKSADNLSDIPSWASIAQGDLHVERDRFFEHLNTLNDKGTDTLILIKAILRDVYRSKNFSEDCARRLVSLKAPPDLLYSLQQSLQASYEAVKVTERILGYLELCFSRSFRQVNKVALSSCRQYLTRDQQREVAALPAAKDDFQFPSRGARNGANRRGNNRGAANRGGHSSRCNNCGGSGHQSRDCPSPNNNNNNNGNNRQPG